MRTLYYREYGYGLLPSIFLAGPSRRRGQEHLPSWRKEALTLLEAKGFKDVVMLPETRTKDQPDLDMTWEERVQWEDDNLNQATCILFWIPRTPELLGLTTNIEWGRWENSGKVVLGYPPDAMRMRYIDHYARKNGIIPQSTLSDTIDQAIKLLNQPKDQPQ